MSTIRTDIITRESAENIKDLEKGIKNQWRWEWLEKKVDGIYLRESIRKLKAGGMAYCLTCQRELMYASRGSVALVDHVKAEKHRRVLKIQKTNFALPGAGDCQQDISNAQYGLHPMFKAVTAGVQSLHTPVADRLRFGVAKTFEEKVVADLGNSFFSFNIDESTSSNHNRIVTLLVNYVTSDLKIVTKHLSSFSLHVVNSDSLFKAIENVVDKNGLKWDKLMSVLLDSCNVMRGRKSGLEKKLRDKCPQLLDIDGDTCHHAHNAAKAFCKPFHMYVEKLATDIHNDFKWSPDLRAILSNICDVLNIKYTVPECFITFRWLSAYDVAQDICRLLDALILVYFPFLRPIEKNTYLHVIVRILRNHNLNASSKDYIRELQSVLSAKILTEAGKERKERIGKKLIINHTKTRLYLGFYVSVLPMLKEYIKLFESAEPLIHRLHTKQKELFTFLGFFIKPEVLHKLKNSSKKIKCLDVSKTNYHLSAPTMFIGEMAKQVIALAPKSQISVVDEFRKLATEAYVCCAKSLQTKMPLCNPFLIAVAAIDPLVRNKGDTLLHLKSIPAHVKNVIRDEDIEEYEKEIHMYVNDPTIKYSKEEKIVEWWRQVEVSGKYRLLCKVAFSLLTCFHGPKVESSFSMMNNIITPGTSSMNVSTFSAIQTIKYELLSQNETAVNLFNKAEFLSEPVDKELCKNLRQSAKLHKEEQKKNLALKEEKERKLQLQKEKVLTKKAAKKVFGDAAKHQRLQHLKKHLHSRDKALRKSSISNAAESELIIPVASPKENPIDTSETSSEKDEKRVLEEVNNEMQPKF
ncbi:hypothetical protein AVEN_173335-1 [Araneus ventricosus]|uniref:HAT C-terminal dimerisation domain-containing protein n=1 Tax=Araneus ventricosus TaxID=182803 RepID=A0A4Y2X735_ARAVE|nr:hypothetical protein AVEN_173335-1 [Araneus ventricosus]